MISVLSKPADQVGVADIRELIDSQVPEGQQIEFKVSLPTEDGSPDRWVTHGDRIGRTAKSKILEESVAFANAYAGTLVLGIAESDARPPVAGTICPIPRCTDLAERLKLVFRDAVEPQIPSLEVFAVPTDGASGVVIIRVGKSRMAPHRVQPTRECTIRRFDRCEKMGMREIQDLTLNLSRGLESVERRLRSRSERFPEEFKCLETPDRAYGIRVTAVPVGEGFQFDRVCREHKLCENLCEPWHSISVMIGDHKTNLDFLPWGESWRPMLRSARNEYSGSALPTTLEMYREIHCDGMVEFGLANCLVVNDEIQSGPRVYPGWPMILFANLLVWADRVRNEALVPMAEYAVDVEMCIRGDGVVIAGYGQDSIPMRYGLRNTKSSSVRYPGELLGEPRYSLGAQRDITDLVALFERDFWNSVGEDVGQMVRGFVIHDWAGSH